MPVNRECVPTDFIFRRIRSEAGTASPCAPRAAAIFLSILQLLNSWPPRRPMSDFFQHGLISTLHRLVDGPIPDRHEPWSALEPVVLVLPCHYGEIGTAALQGIVKTLGDAKFLSRVVISMNGIPDHLTGEVQRFWSRLKKPHVVLWNDSPTLLQQLENKGLQFNSGKGLNLWLAFGWLAAQPNFWNGSGSRL